MFKPEIDNFPFDIQHINLKYELSSISLEKKHSNCGRPIVICFNVHRRNDVDSMLRFKNILHFFLTFSNSYSFDRLLDCRIAREAAQRERDANNIAAIRQARERQYGDDDPNNMPDANIAYGELKIPAAQPEEKEGCLNYPSIWMTIPIYRQPGYVLLTTFLPLFILNLFSLSIFRVARDEERASRVGTLITLLLALFAFMPSFRQQAPIATLTFLDVCVIGSVGIMGFVMLDSVFPPNNQWIYPIISIIFLALGTSYLLVQSWRFWFIRKPKLDSFQGQCEKRDSHHLDINLWHSAFDPTKDTKPLLGRNQYFYGVHGAGTPYYYNPAVVNI